MSGWKKIACAVDFSEGSRAALVEGAGLARRLGAELSMVHVHEPPPGTAYDLLFASAESFQNELEELRGTMDRWEVDARELAGAPVATTLLVGEAAPEIVRFARERALDAVVVATHGRSGLKRAVLGSVAERVAREAPCAVVVVRRPPE